MQVIYKYPLKIDGEVTIIYDSIIKILKIDTQDNWPTLWAIVDTNKEKTVPTKIYNYGTGWNLLKDYGHYIGTAIDGFGYVWHYFINKENFLNEDYYNEIK